MRANTFQCGSRPERHWPFGRWLASVVLAGLPTVLFAASPAQPPTTERRLLSWQQGMEIVNAARARVHELRDNPDCSHLVHQIYRWAGLPYPYASSFDLYTGSENFAPVETPQPGDLIVWPGHVGIVVNPFEQSFYSSLSSGLGTASYESAYWRGRGTPRFYRYALGSSEGSAVASGPPTPPSPAARPTPAGAVGSLTAASAATSFEVPPSVLVVPLERQPTREEVAEAVSELSNAAGNVLRRDDLLRLAFPVVIFDRLRVEKVKVKKDRGWAEVRVESRVAVTGERIDRKRRREKQRWELRRTSVGWMAFPPPERTYVRRDVAVRMLAAQLARLTESQPSTPAPDRLDRTQSHIVRLLGALFEQE